MSEVVTVRMTEVDTIERDRVVVWTVENPLPDNWDTMTASEQYQWIIDFGGGDPIKDLMGADTMTDRQENAYNVTVG